MEIRGKRALVTGAGGGIGRACALMLAREGAECIVIADIDEAALIAVGDEVARFGTEILIETADLSRNADAIAMYHNAERRAGGLDIIHNNAGIMGGPPDFPHDDLQRMINTAQINLVAMMIGTKMGVDFMRARQAPGVIINTSSTAAFGPLPKDPAYAATKRGILAYSESCAPLKDQFGIRVVPLCPAVTDTAIVAKDADWLKPILENIRLLHPEEIAEHVRRIILDDSLNSDAVVVNNERISA